MMVLLSRFQSTSPLHLMSALLSITHCHKIEIFTKLRIMTTTSVWLHATAACLLLATR